MNLSADELYAKLKNIKIAGTVCHFSLEKCQKWTPLINEINQLKQEKNAIILVHSYVSPEIIASVADFVGDSYDLSKNARDSKADIILFVAVRFMAETAKILSPQKTVLIPSQENGCTLADSVTGADVKKLKQQYPDYTFVCYINTTAEVKAECDVCVTSSNVYKIIEKIPNNNIYFLPDKFMGENIIIEMQKREINKNIKLWNGSCYTHEEYEPEMVDYIRLQYPEVVIACHPECKKEVVTKCDYVGSTSQMINFVKNHTKNQFFLITECGLSTRLKLEMPQKSFVGTCTLCKYMKSNTLENILHVLKNPQKADVIEVPEEIRQRALGCIEKMFEYSV